MKNANKLGTSKEAIEFGIWLNGNCEIWGNEWVYANGDGKSYSTEDLYKKYLQVAEQKIFRPFKFDKMCSKLASMLKKCKSIMDEYDMGDDSEENKKVMEDAEKLLNYFKKYKNAK